MTRTYDEAGFNEGDLDVLSWVAEQRREMKGKAKASPPRTSRFPENASEFRVVIRRQNRAAWWAYERVANDQDYFWLKTDQERRAVVCFGDGFGGDGVFVLLDPDPKDNTEQYWFRLKDFYQSFPNWSWARQVGQKVWVANEHLELINELESIFPATVYAKKPKARGQ